MTSPKLKLSLKKEEINWENNIVRPEHHALLEIASSKKQHPDRAVMLWNDSGDYSPFTMCLLRHHWFSCIKYPCCMAPSSSSSHHSVAPGSRLIAAIWPSMCQCTEYSVPAPKEQLIQKTTNLYQLLHPLREQHGSFARSTSQKYQEDASTHQDCQVSENVFGMPWGKENYCREKKCSSQPSYQVYKKNTVREITWTDVQRKSNLCLVLLAKRK